MRSVRFLFPGLSVCAALVLSTACELAAGESAPEPTPALTEQTPGPSPTSLLTLEEIDAFITKATPAPTSASAIRRAKAQVSERQVSMPTSPPIRSHKDFQQRVKQIREDNKRLSKIAVASQNREGELFWDSCWWYAIQKVEREDTAWLGYDGDDGRVSIVLRQASDGLHQWHEVSDWTPLEDGEEVPYDIVDGAGISPPMGNAVDKWHEITSEVKVEVIFKRDGYLSFPHYTSSIKREQLKLEQWCVQLLDLEMPLLH